MRLVFYQPEIPQNVGTLLRLGACLSIPIDLIEPLGFLFSDRHFKRAGLDYLDLAQMNRHASWQAYLDVKAPGRLIALSSHAKQSYLKASFKPDDHLLVGPESVGLPSEIQAQAELSLTIPMEANCRSLNVALAATLVLGEALRQTTLFPPLL